MRGLSYFFLLDCESLKGSLSFTYFCIAVTIITMIVITIIAVKCG